MPRALLLAVLVLSPALTLGQSAPPESPPKGAAPVAIDPGTAGTPVAETPPAPEASTARPAEKPAPEWRSHREIAGHVFVPSSVIVDPFSQTAFGLRFGLGSGNATGPSLDWTGFPTTPPTIVPASRDYGYYGLGFGTDFSVRFLEWLSARLVIGGDAYLGSGRDSILVVGTQVKVLADLNLKGSFNVGKNFRLAFGLDVTYGPALNVLVANGIIEAIQNRNPEGTDFLKRTNTITWIPGFYGAWAPFPFLGASLNLQYLNPMTTQTGTSSYVQNGWSLAAGVDFDLAPLVRAVPIGLSVAYKLVGPLGSTGVTRTDTLDVGLFYTGKKDLALGIDIDMRWTTLQGDLASKVTAAILTMRYYF